ncbi:trichohyalin [Aplysia californica]|uniref:Trichohyalin n=1 Tax=Aplysia californica TaxID=6500 RepID=A0ABM1VVB4_APLCA|nr:trichohyalin [Aplysia californica]
MALQSQTQVQSTQGRLLESPTDVYSQLSQKLTDDGLNKESTDLEKLLFLWKLHQHLEDDLQKARETEQKLKETQSEEMKEVESYVEHIRHLSDEREALIQELEAENEGLKAQVVNLEQGNNEAAQAEIVEMLTQQGLAEISDATQSEQIAYLLVERARLLDELEEHNNSNSNNNSNNNSNSNNPSPNVDGRSSEMELKQILEQERGDFEEELSQQRESAIMMKEQLKQEHEEEINALMEENSKLEEDLQKAEMMVSQLKAELNKFEEGDAADSGLLSSLPRPSSNKEGDDEERKKMAEERNELNKRREDLEKEMAEVENEKEELKKEKGEIEKEKASLESERASVKKQTAKLSQLQGEVDTEQEALAKEKQEVQQEKEGVREEKEEVRREKEGVQKARQELDNRRADLEQEEEEFHKEKEAWEKENKDSPRAQSLRNGSPSRSPNDMAIRKIIEEKTKIEGELVTIRTQLRSLQKEKDSHDDVVYKLKGDLEKSHMQQQQLQVKNRTLKADLQELEAQLDETETSIDSISKEKQSLSEKCDSLNSEVKTLRVDAMKSSTLQDIVDILSNDKKQLSESLESLKSKFEQTSSEKEQLANQNNRLSKEEQELTNQLQACKEELERVQRERDGLSSDKHELLQVKVKQEEVEGLLRGELEEMSKVKEKFVSQTESLSKENKDLLNKLEQTREELDAAKTQVQELAKQQIIIDHLKEQNQSLQLQMKTSHEELDKSKDRETMLITTQQSLQKSHDDIEKRHTHEIDDLKLKLELTLQELAKTKKSWEDLAQDKEGLEENLKRTEKLLHESAEVKDILEEEKRQKNGLKLEINRLELQLAEKTVEADKFESERKHRLELESKVGTLRDVEESLKVISRELEKERKMRESLEFHSEELEKTLSVRVSREDLVQAEEEADRERECRIELEAKVKDTETKVRELERAVKEAEISGTSSSEQLQNERTLRLSLEANVKELQSALAEQSSAEELSRLRSDLNKEREAVRELQESREDVELLCGELEKERGLRAELTRQVAELEAANEDSASSTLKATLDELERERRARAECDMRLQEMEQVLEDQRMDSDSLQHSMSGKMKSLEKRVQALQDDLFAAQDELQSFQDRYDQAMQEAEVAKLEAARSQVQTSNQRSALRSPAADSTDGDKHQQDLELSLLSTSAKLQETLNELNTLKSQLCRTQEELNGRDTDVIHSRKEVELLKQSLEMSTNQLEVSEDELRNLRRELADANCATKIAESRLADKQAKLDAVVQDRDEIQRELDTLCDEQQQRVTPRPLDPTFYGEEERQEHVDRIGSLEKLSRTLELDNREMARKLSDTMSKCETYEEQLQREKLRSTDKHHQSSRYTEQLEHDLDAANKHVRQLREELQQLQTKVFKLEADNLGLSAKYESSIARLEQDNKEMKHRHRQELDSLSERMEGSSTEARELRGHKREMEQELSQIKSEMSRVKSNNERLESHLQSESKQRLDLENRNSVIDNEMTKVWSQVRSLMEKNAELESNHRTAEQELNLKKSALRQVETNLVQKEATYEASSKAILARAEAAERKDNKRGFAKDLQQELEEVTQKLLNVERQLSAADTGKGQLEDTKDKLVTIRNQLEGEKLQRTLLDQTVAELKHQVALLKQREAKVSSENKELQHTILDLEGRLNQLQDTSSAVSYDPQIISDVGKRSLMDQIGRLQREVKDLQYELYNVSERRDVDVKRYEERKLRTKEKLMKAREFYTSERSKYMDHMKHLDDDLRLTRATLTKELQWREKMDDSYKQLLREKRDLITQLSELEESSRDKSRGLSMAQVRSKYLEEENSRLQDRLQAVCQQKHNLDRLLKDHGKREKIRAASPVEHTGCTSGLGNSLDSAWDPNDRLDSCGQSWSSSHQVDPPANFRKTGGSGGLVAEHNTSGGRGEQHPGGLVRGLNIYENSQPVGLKHAKSCGNISMNSASRNSGSISMNSASRNNGSISLYPQMTGDYSLYSEIDDLKVRDDYDDEDDEFEA